MHMLIVVLVIISLVIAALELADSRGQRKLAWSVGFVDVAMIIWLLQ